MDPIRVLLIEDDPDVSRLVARRLVSSRVAPFEVEWAEDLQSALREIETRRFEAVLLDLGLPDGEPMSTLALAGALARHLPILVLTASEDPELAKLAGRIGCVDYLVKPQGIDALSRALLGAIERHRWVRAREAAS